VDGDHGPGAEPAGQGKVRMIGIVAASTSMAAAVAGALALARRDSRRRVLGVPVGTRPRLERNASAVVGGLAALAAPAVALRSRVGRRG
jgi:hypothetical protein